jgi:hypothetical protein
MWIYGLIRARMGFRYTLGARGLVPVAAKVTAAACDPNHPLRSTAMQLCMRVREWELEARRLRAAGQLAPSFRTICDPLMWAQRIFLPEVIPVTLPPLLGVVVPLGDVPLSHLIFPFRCRTRCCWLPVSFF